MPKMKSRRAATKRFRISKSGKVMRRHANTRHLLECKSKRKKRHMRHSAVVSPTDTARVRQMLAGG
jgi:large subunit ribosomal protein L35